MLLDGSGPVIGRLSIKRSTNLAFSPAPRTGGRDTDRGARPRRAAAVKLGRGTGTVMIQTLANRPYLELRRGFSLWAIARCRPLRRPCSGMVSVLWMDR